MAKAVTKSKKVVAGASFKGSELAEYFEGCEIWFDKEVEGESRYALGFTDKVSFKIGTKVYSADQVEIIIEEA